MGNGTFTDVRCKAERTNSEGDKVTSEEGGDKSS